MRTTEERLTQIEDALLEIIEHVQDIEYQLNLESGTWTDTNFLESGISLEREPVL